MKRKNTIRKNKLPFIMPKVCTYPYFSALVAILSVKDKEDIWLFNNYILIWAMKGKYNVDYWIDFKFGNEMRQEDFCPMIEKKIITRIEIHEKYSDILKAIKYFIDSNNYVMVSVDVFYIDKWWGSKKNKRHFRHQICVHGYDYYNNLLSVSDFIEGRYTVFEVACEEFEKGYYNYKKYVPYEEFGEDVWLLSCKDGEETLDIERIGHFIVDFLRAEDAHVTNHIQLEKKVENYVFGIEVMEELVLYLEEIKKENGARIDKRPFHILVEMHKIMMWRFDFIFEKYRNINVSCERKEEVMTLIKQQKKYSETLLFLVLKYNTIACPDTIDSIINKLKEYKKKEIIMLEKCLYIIDIIRIQA